MPKGIPLTKQHCFHVASGFDSIAQLAKYDRGVYQKCLKEGWLDIMTWLSRVRKVRGTWTKEACRDEASKYSTMNEFWKNCPSACATARKHGWLKEFTWLEVIRKSKVTEKECRAAARKYATLKEFRENDRKLYTAAWRYGWLDGFTWLKRNRGSRRRSACRNS